MNILKKTIAGLALTVLATHCAQSADETNQSLYPGLFDSSEFHPGQMKEVLANFHKSLFLCPGYETYGTENLSGYSGYNEQQIRAIVATFHQKYPGGYVPKHMSTVYEHVDGSDGIFVNMTFYDLDPSQRAIIFASEGSVIHLKTLLFVYNCFY